MPKCLECGIVLPRLQWTHFRYNCTGKFKNGREYQKAYYNAELVDLDIKEKTAVTLNNLIKKYGTEIGTIKWEEYKNKQAYSNSFEYKKRKHKWTKKKWTEFNKSRAITLNNLVKKYGSEIGLIKWEEYCDKQKITKSKEYVIKKYGIDRWNEMCRLKYQPHDPIYISEKEGITIEEAISKISSKRGVKYTSKLELEFIASLEALYQKLDHTTNSNPFGKWDHINHQYVIYDIKHQNCIIEFNGDYWHANPRLYKPTDMIRNQLASDIWEKDKRKIKLVEDEGFSVYVVWESDYLENRSQTIKKVIEWIQNTQK